MAIHLLLQAANAKNDLLEFRVVYHGSNILHHRQSEYYSVTQSVKSPEWPNRVICCQSGKFSRRALKPARSENGCMARTTATFTVSVPPAMVVEIEQVRKDEHRTRSELIREALRRYFADRPNGVTRGAHSSR